MPNINSNVVQLPTELRDNLRSNATASAVPANQAGRLGKQDFLKLLMAQLSNQDPLKPMDDTQMIAQMAQFSALEEMQALSKTIQQTSNMSTIVQAGALIGKYVQAAQADGSIVSGVVNNVNLESTDGVVSPTVTVDGQIVDYSSIRTVSSSPVTDGSTT
jgi:flagellar basal-body rod modification protein FlgD